MINFRRQQLLKIKPTYSGESEKKHLKKVMSDAIIMNLRYTLVKHIFKKKWREA